MNKRFRFSLKNARGILVREPVAHPQATYAFT